MTRRSKPKDLGRPVGPQAEDRRRPPRPPERDTLEFLAGLILGSLIGAVLGVVSMPDSGRRARASGGKRHRSPLCRNRRPVKGPHGIFARFTTR